MKMNKVSWQDGWDQHLRQKAAYLHVNGLQQADINAFMKTWTSLFCSPPLKGVVEKHSRLEENLRDTLQVI
ncbi:MAG: hypothetical protein N2A40_03015 [Desulfobulbaceae bacterium]